MLHVFLFSKGSYVNDIECQSQQEAEQLAKEKTNAGYHILVASDAIHDAIYARNAARRSYATLNECLSIVNDYFKNQTK